MDKERRKSPEGFEDCFEHFEDAIARRIAEDKPETFLEGEELVTAAFKFIDELYDKRDREVPSEE